MYIESKSCKIKFLGKLVFDDLSLLNCIIGY